MSVRGFNTGSGVEQYDYEYLDNKPEIPTKKSDIGLGNVDNTSDLDKPISTATQTALNEKVPNSRKVNGKALSADVSITSEDIGYDASTAYGSGTVGKELTNLNRQISESITPAIDEIETALDGKAPVIINTASGDIASFADGADGMPVKSLVANIEPVQDLHGYSNPWPAGGGKNLFGTDDIDRLHKNVTFKSETDSAGNRFGVKLTGAYSGETATATLGYATLSAGSYKVSGGDENVQLSIRPGSSSAAQIGQVTTGETTITLESATDIYLIARVVGTFTSGLVIKPMIRLASVTDATFAPYSNICPITGWTGMTVADRGGNVWDEQWEIGAYDQSTGEKSTNTALIRCVNAIPVLPSSKYYLDTAGEKMRVLYYDATETFIRTEAELKTNDEITTPANARYLRFYMGANYGTSYKGDISIAFVQETTISWQTGAGTVYSGTVDPINGTLTVDKKGITFDGSSDEAWQFVNTANRAYIAVSDIITTVPDNSVVDIKSNQYEADRYDRVGITKITGRYNIAQINVFDYSILVGSNYNELLAKWQAHLSEHPLQVIYPLTTPIVYTLTPTEIRSLLGENHVTVDAGSIESLVYCVDTAAIIERIDADLSSLDGRVDTLEDEMDTAQSDITSLETAVEQLDTDIKAVDAKADKKAPAIYSTASGDIASFSDGADDMPMTSVVATITPKQDLNGYDHPWVGGAGKNLLNPSILEVGGLDSTTGAETAVNTRVRTGFIEVPAGTYTLSNGANLTSAYFVYDASGNFVSSNVAWQTTKTVTVAEQSKLRFLFRIDASTVMTVDDVVNPQLEAGSSATTYEPYENICPIEGYTGMSTTVTGKNLWKLGGDIDSLWFDNMAIGATGKLVASAANCRANVVKVTGGEQFVISGFDFTQFAANSILRVFVTKEYPGNNVDAYRLANATANGQTITIPSGYNWLVCLTFVNTGVTLDMPAQLEYGTTPTDYEEYAGSTTTVSWQTEAGTVYSGTVDAVSGKLVVTHLYRQYTGQANEEWRYSTWTKEATYTFYSTDPLTNVINPNTSNYNVIKHCNQFVLSDYNTLQTTDEPGIAISGSGPSYPSVRIPKSLISEGTAEAFRAYLATKPLEIVYELLNPIVHQLSPQQIKTLYAQNHVWTDVGEVSITYPTDTKLYVDNLFASIPTASGVSF